MSVRNTNRLQRNTLSVALLSALLLTANAAMAQETTETKPADAQPTGAASEKKDEATELGAITVTGSRIARDTFNSVSPVQVITREESTLAGFASTASLLQGTAVTGGTAQINNAFGGFVVDGGPGVNTLSLRGLGASRTLILLNGRRVAPAGSRGSVGSADLNVLPNAMIDHVEVLKDGASSIYGSDAVAGVVNIVTRDKVNDLTVEAQYNVTEDGGGDETRYSLVWGQTGDRYDISASFEAYDRNELTLGDRDWTRCNTDYRRNLAIGDFWGSGDTIDPITGKPKCYPITGTGSNGVTINTIGTNNITGVAAKGATGTVFNRWRPNSAVTTGLVGFEGVGGGLTTNTNIRDTFDPKMLNRSLISPVKVRTAFLQGGYDLDALGGAEVYFELLGNERKSSQTGYRQLSLDYWKGSPLIPANLQASTFQNAPTAITNGPVGVRAFIGFGNDKSEQEVDYWKGTAGIKGDFIWTDWNYDFALSHADSDANYTFESWLTDRVKQSLDVVAGPGGTFVCRNPANGCVAAPALTSAVIGGVLPQAWKDWTFVPVTGSTKYKETTATFNIDGPLFAMPYGEAQGAFGVEYRKAKIDDTPPIDSQNGNLYNLTSAAITRGSDSVWEAYGEVEFPLLSGMSWAEELTMNVSARLTDYDSYGSDTTYKIGGLWTPFNWISLRGAYGTSYRAPALFEQFLGATSGFLSNQNDPCNNYGADPGSIRAANCASEGLPPNFVATQSVQVLTAGGAEAGLKAETSKNMTVGVILQPELSESIGDISFAVDYFDIEVDNGVSRAGATNILQLCYDDPDFRAGGGFCRLVDPRTPGSNALTVHDSYVNLATDKVRGYDFTLRYVRDIGPGTLRATTEITHYLEQASKLFSDDPLDDVNGTINNPEYSGTLDVAYGMKNWKIRYGVEWVGAMQSYDFFGLNGETDPRKLYVKDYFTHNISGQYNFDTWEVTAGIQNFTNATPPSISSGVYNRVGNAPLYSGYDYVGRTFFVNVSKTF
ncbi:outer membrane receptor protein involved in Fe transport [Lysobacter niabensis]|uniref:Outer membrane receptor protein involved in Fe transport n=1 Tax=Agrilutibacter niabensis TaxID=380628 RepID=A0ABU1VNS0_9GAMM|nr:TonB-dependent receptor [Lysobacter niabensis]MDR7099107.1 outer membrane receptor protein involved in Fe transport [Lysobacter niabensis]